MPVVNVYYNFTKDRLIDPPIQIAFNAKPANLVNDMQSVDSYKGVVKNVYIDNNEIEVAVELEGIKSTNWSITVQVEILPRKATDKLHDLSTSPITDTLPESGYAWHAKVYSIL
ncbi:hypothetical protein SAMN05660909_04150 [Chitinophaga terrae (ex Kim and Jung 2007)]|jgi:hypothetical protein|uniref:Uncharacterized protein n=1 Tax=Chitinophaga terrae (ex Kim and Jung 2007) TaxID=408074 RepID=A0A1H4F3T6_9BACT|nr:hypothetical protein [Chitinophaga terrae (ex Kim and Jung 2007)]MDQ0106498.1 hypothetical protein [Chitinophaga terrae (ex Kim and Jung 2007)]GEP92017.1 hypothetical protein CTE07_36620 [Chitinophaga terrae (ex Kim and Jung 2007)]SEA91984.1 hypothetical protein SAMN05660909_04150 [Chitinophaga terrae (ex Kim and Jung 2007)]